MESFSQLPSTLQDLTKSLLPNSPLRGLYESAAPEPYGSMTNLPPDVVRLIAKFLPHDACYSLWSANRQFNRTEGLESMYLKSSGDRMMEIGDLSKIHFPYSLVERYHAKVNDVGCPKAYTFALVCSLVGCVSGLLSLVALCPSAGCSSTAALGFKIGTGIGCGTGGTTCGSLGVMAYTIDTEADTRAQREDYETKFFARVASVKPEFQDFLKEASPAVYTKVVALNPTLIEKDKSDPALITDVTDQPESTL